MELSVARAIINEAIEGGYVDSMPEKNGDVVSLAEDLYSHAQKESNQDKYIKAIIELGADDEVEEFLPRKTQWAIPKTPKGEALEIPRDITAISEMEVRRLYSEYGAWVSAAKQELSLVDADLSNTSHLRDDAYREAFSRVDRIDEETGKSKLKEVIDLEARRNPDFKKLEDEVRRLTIKRNKLKALVEIYSSNCDRLSREMTMRHNEWEHSR